jgi:riboflavin kinase/FMN adenylyltransferase
MSMRLYASLEEVADAPTNGRAVAIGVFDGVHRGHQRILLEAIEHARSSGALSAAVTFYPHPEALLRPRSAPRMLTSLERKAQLLEALSIDELVVVRFDQEFARLSPELFCRKVLSDHLGARLVYVGENFRFGHQGLGTAADLAAYGAAHGFRVRPVALVEESGEVISSTRIRDLLRRGQVAEAAGLLGRPHRIEGPVITGAGRGGRVLEAPTANLSPERPLALPALGIYVTRSTVERGDVYCSVTSVGTNPTFEKDRKVRVETVLLDYQGDLYGAHLAVDFLARIRAQRAFPDAESLAAQIKRDIEVARQMHSEGEALPK